MGVLLSVESKLDAAVISSLVLFLGSTIALWDKSVEHLSTTSLGRVMLVYSTPMNFIIYNVSAVPVIYCPCWNDFVITKKSERQMFIIS